MNYEVQANWITIVEVRTVTKPKQNLNKIYKFVYMVY
jgi:hypothetical protein